MNVALMATQAGRTITNPDAETFARWAWERHLETCRECAHGLEYCPAGRKYLEATRPDTTWIPDYPDGAR